jgi:HSP20 family protein
MALPVIRRSRRPGWMTPFGEEGFGDLFFDRLWNEWTRWQGEELVPTFNFYEKEGKYYITAEIPGVDKEDISVSLENNVLTISGKKESSKEEEGVRYYLKESRYGSFSRSVRLPGEVSEEDIEASYKDGILTLVARQAKEPKTKKIEIKA